MKSKYWWYGIFAIAIIGVIVISYVQQPKQETVTCNPPYIKVGTTCCLDENNNNICDKDEQIAPEENQLVSQSISETKEKYS
ncbi:MAG: hypothetical protein ACXQTD_08740 [Candidatus Syntropharchaeia archaeon]